MDISYIFAQIEKAMDIEIPAAIEQYEWLENLAQRLGTRLEEGGLTLPDEIGKGYFKQYHLDEGLVLTIHRVLFDEAIIWRRRENKDSQWFPVTFYTNDIACEQQIATERRLVGSNMPTGIFLTSGKIGSEWNLPPGVENFNITLAFHMDWFSQHLNHRESWLEKQINSGHPFYLFESLTPAIRQSLEKIKDLHESPNALARLELQSLSLHLLYLFFVRLERRHSSERLPKLNGRDVEAVFHARSLILNQLADCPTVSTLAQKAGMSSSKLQKSFRQVFGMSVGAFAQHERMEWAKRLLTSNCYTVSEVGYLVGYSNLSHFAEAFRRHTGTNPKRWKGESI